LQYAVDQWEGLLRASGSAIEPSKSWWVLVDFTWDDNLHDFRYQSIDKMPGELEYDGSWKGLTLMIPMINQHWASC
jgi:hypothetical protein